MRETIVKLMEVTEGRHSLPTFGVFRKILTPFLCHWKHSFNGFYVPLFIFAHVNHEQKKQGYIFTGRKRGFHWKQRSIAL